MRLVKPIKTVSVNIKSSQIYYKKSGRKGIPRNPFITVASFFWKEIGEDLIQGKSYHIPSLGYLITGRFENYWKNNIPKFRNWYTELDYVPMIKLAREKGWHEFHQVIFTFKLSDGLHYKLQGRIKKNPDYANRFQLIKRKGQL